MARVVILGGSGFVGRLLGQELADQESLSLSSGDLDLAQADAGERLAAQLREGDRLVFISALTPDRGRDVGTLMKNLRMAEQVCLALAKVAPAHVTYVSSDAVYADDAHPVTESSPAAPSSFHGTMHLAREQMLAHVCKERKLPLLILRPPSLFGALDTHNSYGPNRFLRLALEGKEITLFGEGEERRDHLYGQDFARLVALGSQSGKTGVLNVASGHSPSFGEVAQAVSALRPGTVVKGTPRQNPITHRHFDIAELRRAFPEFQPTTLEDGLRQTERELGTPAAK